MLKTRIENINRTSWTRKSIDVDIRTRNDALLALEGWYETDMFVPDDIETYYAAWKQSGTTLRFSRYLARLNLFSAAELSQYGKEMVTTKFKVSCRHNDLVRIGDTPHYRSCMASNTDYAKQQLLYITDPDVAIAYVADASGKFVWRCLLRLVQNQFGDYALVTYRVYGNGPTTAIFRKLAEARKIDVHEAVDIRRKTGAGVDWFTSPTTVNNNLLKQPIWTDHQLRMSKSDRKIQILARTRPTGSKSDVGDAPAPDIVTRMRQLLDNDHNAFD